MVTWPWTKKLQPFTNIMLYLRRNTVVCMYVCFTMQVVVWREIHGILPWTCDVYYGWNSERGSRPVRNITQTAWAAQPWSRAFATSYLRYIPTVSSPAITVYLVSFETPLPSSRRHLSYNDCLEDTRENYFNCSVLCCVWQLYTVICTHMSSSERWVLV